MFSRCAKGENRFVKTDKHNIEESTMVTFEKRLESFEGWPADRSPKADQLAKCGFYLSAGGKHTYCYYCGNSKDDWRTFDNPWTEHALLCNDCPFVLLNRSTYQSYNWNAPEITKEPSSLFELCQVSTHNKISNKYILIKTIYFTGKNSRVPRL